MWFIEAESLEFVDQGEYSFAVEVATNSVVVLVKKDGEQRRFSTRHYLKIILERYFQIVDKHDDRKDEEGIWSRITAAANAKSKLQWHISRIRDYEIEHNIPKENTEDYSDIIERADIAIDRIKLDMELLKYKLDVKKVRNETKRYREWIVIGTALVSATTLAVTISNGCNNRKNNSPQQPTTNAASSPISRNAANVGNPVGR